MAFTSLPNLLPFQQLRPGSLGTLVRMMFLSLSMSGMVSKSLSSTELSVSEWHGCPPSEGDICLPGLELDSSETENSLKPRTAYAVPSSAESAVLNPENPKLVPMNSLPTGQAAPLLPSSAASILSFLPFQT